LLVGKNNSGQSSVLEAIQIFQFVDKIEALVNVMRKRGEYILEESPLEYDISHLFYRHKFEIGEYFRFTKINDKDLDHELSVNLDFIQPKQLSLLQKNTDRNMIPDELRLVIQSSNGKESEVKFPITINIEFKWFQLLP
jgi:predicted ATP-dependent endonuclease of OLD family